MPGHGASASHFDPVADPCRDPAIWCANTAAAIVILDAAPAIIDHIAFSDARVIHAADDGWHIVVAQAGRTHRLWLRRDTAPMAAAEKRSLPGFHLPLDPLLDARLAATRRVADWLDPPPPASGQPLALSRRSARRSADADTLTALQSARFDLMLAMLHAEASGASLRDLGALAYPVLPRLNAAEWKASSERRRTHRLLTQAKALRDGGYRVLLAAG